MREVEGQNERRDAMMEAEVRKRKRERKRLKLRVG